MENAPPELLPTCIGFIMDGNRRYAQATGLSLVEGHAKGYVAMQSVVEWVAALAIPHVVFYAFSTENWRRSATEVDYLMTLLRHAYATAEATFNTAERNIRIRCLGQRSDFDPDIQASIREVEARTAANTGTTVWIALSYGGRAEIVAAIQSLAASGAAVTEAALQAHLWSAEMPDPDLVVRTSGEQRLSNFLPWQTVYSELFFTPTLWPAFTKDEFTRILLEYANRQRRHGA